MEEQGRVSKESLLLQANQWEYCILRLGFELLSKFVRTSQRSLEKEIDRVANNIISFAKNPNTRENAANFLKDQVNRLKELKEKLFKAIEFENKQLAAIKERVDHASVPERIVKKKSGQPVKDWYNVRLSCVIFDYLMREGYSKTAQQLLLNEHLENLVDIKIYTLLRNIITNLEKRKCSEALKWCGENRSRLKKNNSSLELHLRIQEFLQKVETNKLQAIQYAKKWLQPYCSSHGALINKAMGTLAFTSIQNSPYKEFLSQEKWHSLIHEFKQDFAALYGLPVTAMLTVDFEAGLTLLKTEQCFIEEEKLLNCPVCQPPFNELSKGLPFSSKNISTLICRVSGKPMIDDNHPMVLPNGYVYSKEALDEMASANHGVITCPRTGIKYKYNELRKIFIM